MPKLVKHLGCSLLALSVVVLSSPGAKAGLVTYSTEGGFGSKKTSVSTFTLSGKSHTSETLTVLFTPVGPTSIASLPGFGAVGNFTVSLSGLALTTSKKDVEASVALTVNQTAPSAHSGTFSGDLSGKLLAGAANSLEIEFDKNTLHLGNLTYTLYQQVLGLYVPLSLTDDRLFLGNLDTLLTGASVTTTLYARVTQQGNSGDNGHGNDDGHGNGHGNGNGNGGGNGAGIAVSAVPEPSTLTGAAGAVIFLGLAFARRRLRGDTAA